MGQLWDLLKEDDHHRRRGVYVSLLMIQKLCWYFSLPILNFPNDESKHLVVSLKTEE